MSETPDIVERLRSVEVFISTTGNMSPVAYEAAAEITRLRAALEAERERCAKVADEHRSAAENGIESLQEWGIEETGRHTAFRQAAINIASAIRALPPPEAP